MDFTLSEYEITNSDQIEHEPLGLLFLDLYLAKYEDYLSQEELEWIEARLIESDDELNRQRRRVYFLNDITNEHCADLLSTRRDALDDLRVPDWVYDFTEI